MAMAIIKLVAQNAKIAWSSRVGKVLDAGPRRGLGALGFMIGAK
jgi:hypothetical protein